MYLIKTDSLQNLHIGVAWMITKGDGWEVDSIVLSFFSIAPLGQPKVGTDWRHTSKSKDYKREYTQDPGTGSYVSEDYRKADCSRLWFLFCH